MKREQLYNQMQTLYNQTKNKSLSTQDLIKQAVQLGINYEYDLLKEGINIVFEESKKG